MAQGSTSSSGLEASPAAVHMNMTAGNGGGLSDMNGVLIFDLEGKGASKTPDIKFTGQYTSNFNGAVYFPYAHLTFRGGSGLTGCMVVVAKVLDFGGNSSMDMSGCSDSILPNNVAQTKRSDAHELMTMFHIIHDRRGATALRVYAHPVSTYYVHIRYL